MAQNYKTYLSLFQIQTVLSEKPEVADFSKVADILGTSHEELESEWKILSSHLPASPVGTASVDRSFSTMNRILSSE